MPREFPRTTFSNRRSSPLSRIAKTGQLAAHDLELGAHVVAGNADVDDAHLVAAHCAADRTVEFALGAFDRLDIIRMGGTPCHSVNFLT